MDNEHSVKETRKCELCGVDVERYICDFKKRCYCSRQHANIGNVGSHHGSWKGGRVKDSQGYILAYSPNHPNVDGNGYVLEHRLVMEEKLGRLLLTDEVAHHINGNKADNRPGNLELMSRSNHMAYHGSKHGKWSLKFDKCTSCGENNSKYAGNGLCRTCYERNRKNKEGTHANG